METREGNKLTNYSWFSVGIGVGLYLEELRVGLG